ncbi:MAG: precorrin-3B C(17)-methyltransferase [Gloeomargarita sp. SKYBB_i_bin120]|nr:precorrin-3B C(17)-methyltransferase [Gloeomargarita sp. SKYB120]MDW8177615.1 precorrin-3B C(17)-methyltransferase [Gloeomargarita sp. SKYBB_i_bin120]
MTGGWDAFQPIAWVATTPVNQTRFLTLARHFGGTIWCSPQLATHPDCHAYGTSLRDHLQYLWADHRTLVLGLTLGAVVRLIAPLLTDKQRDPLVLCIPESGQYVITVCGGHQRQGDWLCQAIASWLNAQAIITDASSAQGLPGVDTWGHPWGWRKGAGDWTALAGALIRGEPVQVVQEAGQTLWRQALPPQAPLLWTDSPDAHRPQIWITHRQVNPTVPHAIWHPRVLWVGVGCARGTPAWVIQQAIAQVFAEHALALDAIAGLASIDIKQDEAGLVALCQNQGWPLRTFPADQLRAVAVPNPSPVVAQAVGTPSVAEAAAVQAAQGPLLVPKQVLDNVTVAVALAPQEFLDRQGYLYLVGAGPGDLSQLTPAARCALAHADVVIGYRLYLELLAPLKRPGQIWEAYGIGQETERAQRAIDLATWGLTVAVVSSGDSGIYGMAGVVLELLHHQQHQPLRNRVQIVPGISALQAVASRVGVPLMQDFCAISLSDLHVPWETIAHRLTQAAQGDWVTVLYNPCSSQRTWQLPAAQAIFLQHRDPKTPVAVVRQAYRSDEQIWRSDLAHFTQLPVDMFCTVIIGNRRSYWSDYGLITPRREPPEPPHFAPQTQNSNSG